VRFIVIRKPNGSWGTALDACLICGTAGYRQEGSNVICRNLRSAIYIPTIGEAGGCNPVGVPSRAENGALVIDVANLAMPEAGSSQIAGKTPGLKIRATASPP
jgi:uncharacterized membrane protein